MGRATAPTVSNNGKTRIELEKKWKWSLGSVAKRLWAQRIWKEASFEGGALLPILFFIVAPITIITDKKVGAGFRNSIFAKHSGAASAHNWLRGPLWGSGWGFRAYIGMQSAHFRAIYSYIWKHDMRFYTSLPLSLFRPGFTRFSMRGWPSPPPPQPCALSRKCICTIWRRQKMKECFQPIQASVCFQSSGVININLTNVTSLLLLLPIPPFFI